MGNLFKDYKRYWNSYLQNYFMSKFFKEKDLKLSSLSTRFNESSTNNNFNGNTDLSYLIF